MPIFFDSVGGGGRPKQLFNGSRIEQLLADRKTAMKQEVGQIPEGHLGALDDEAYVKALLERFGVVLPQLTKTAMRLEDLGEVEVDVSFNNSYSPRRPGQKATVPGRRVSVVVPFVGTAAVFAHDPPGSCGVKPLGEVRGDALVHTIEYPGSAAPDIKAGADKFVYDTERWVQIAKESVEEHQRTLVSGARSLLEQRRERARAAQKALASSGLPVGFPPEPGKSRIADVIVRRPAPLQGAPRGPIPLAPALRDATFDHILEVLRAGGRVRH